VFFVGTYNLYVKNIPIGTTVVNMTSKLIFMAGLYRYIRIYDVVRR